MLDEIGRGTSTFDGLSIAWAVAGVHTQSPGLRAKTLFATHYHELTAGGALPHVRNYNVAVSEAAAGGVLAQDRAGRGRSLLRHPRRASGRAAAGGGDPAEPAGGFVGQGGAHATPAMPRQLALFPETNPLVDELKAIDMNALSPIKALDKLYEWQRKYVEKDG